MLIEHGGEAPEIDPSAWVAPTAVISGAVSIGPDARILYGAVLTAEGGSQIEIGAGCVVMEQAVLRSSGRFDVRLGTRVLVGPHAYLSGCTVGSRSFVATGAMVFNGAELGDDGVVALGGKVHIDTQLPDGFRVPISYIALGRPARLYAPDEALSAHEELDRLGFMHYVFGLDARDRSRAEVMDEALSKYVAVLSAHRDDRIIDG